MDTSKVIAIAHGNSHDDIETLLKAISQFYDYSPLAFEIDTYIQQEKQETTNGILIDLYEPVFVIQPQKARKIEETIEAIYRKPIIYIGERHGNYEDHKVQLQVIMALSQKGRKFAIGMEMFQKPFQKAIDDYISGKIDQREFLKNTQYFKRWQFDYNYYREILEYAKAKNIPVVALNLWTEIIKKVSADGIHSLTEVEKGEIPEDMDMTDKEYRDRLQSIFRHHRNLENKNFEYFYQSQILWDETMAHTIDSFLKKNPDYQMVVLAGAGHVMYGSGIPQRTYRLNKKDYTILMPDTGNLDVDIGNFIFSPVPQSPPMTLKLGVVLKETDKGVKINQVVPGSIAKSAGLEEGDIIAFLDDWRIEEIDDVKIFMSDKSRGEKIRIKVLRWGLFTGYKEYELNATL